MTRGYVLAGLAEPPSCSLDFAEKECRLVEAISVPAGDPFAIADQVLRDPVAVAAFTPEGLADIGVLARQQVLAIERDGPGGDRIAAVGWHGCLSHEQEDEVRWQSIRAIVTVAPLKWDNQRGFIPKPVK